MTTSCLHFEKSRHSCPADMQGLLTAACDGTLTGLSHPGIDHIPANTGTIILVYFSLDRVRGEYADPSRSLPARCAAFLRTFGIVPVMYGHQTMLIPFPADQSDDYTEWQKALRTADFFSCFDNLGVATLKRCGWR